MPNKKINDFCRTKQTRIIAKKMPTLTKKPTKKMLDLCLFGRAKTLKIFW
jgi:hypothetical protein